MTLHQVHQLERDLDAMKKELAESQKQLQVCYGVVCGVWCGLWCGLWCVVSLEWVHLIAHVHVCT